jgi:tRNA methyl transferase
MYVCEKNIIDNKVILGRNEDLFKKEFEACDFNWIACEPPTEEMTLYVKVRYSQKENKARVIPLSDDRVRVIFDEPQRAITVGQSAVMYDGDIVYGGGVICKVI